MTFAKQFQCSLIIFLIEIKSKWKCNEVLNNNDYAVKPQQVWLAFFYGQLCELSWEFLCHLQAQRRPREL